MKQARPLLMRSIVGALCFTAGFSVMIQSITKYDLRLKQANQRITLLETALGTRSQEQNNNGSLAFDKRLGQAEQTIDQLQRNQGQINDEISKFSKFTRQALRSAANAMPDGKSQDKRAQLEEYNEPEAASQEQNFNSQPQDAKWSTETVSWIENHVDKELFNATNLLDLECRETVCRMTTEHKDLASYSLFNLEFPALMAGQFQRISMEQEEMADGGVRTVMYLDASYSSTPE